MSSDATGWVYRHSPFKGATFQVHLALADSVNDQHRNEFWMTQGKLATKARVTRPTANEALAAIAAGGFLIDLGSAASRVRRFRFLFPDVPVVYESRFSPDEVVGTDDNGVSAQPTTVVGTDDTEPKGTQGEPKSNKRGTAFPEAFFVTEPMREWHAANTPSVDLKVETAQFADYHRAKGDTARDWVASWRTWMRNAVKFQGQRAGGRSPSSPRPVDPDRGIDNDRDGSTEVTYEWLWGEPEPEVGQA